MKQGALFIKIELYMKHSPITCAWLAQGFILLLLLEWVRSLPVMNSKQSLQVQLPGYVVVWI